MAKLGEEMLFSVEHAFAGREEIRAPLKTPAWEARVFDDKPGLGGVSIHIHSC